MGSPVRPPVERRLALSLAGTAARRELDRGPIERLAAQASFPALEAFLREQGMLSLLGERLLGLVEDIPSWFAAAVADYTRRARQQGIDQQLLTVRLLGGLQEAGLRAMPLKGVALGERLHGDLGGRVCADIDLLVAPEELRTAVEIIRGLGYERPPGRPPLTGRPVDLHECLVSPAGLPEVEVHWRIDWYEERFAAQMLTRALPGPDGLLCPHPTDDLAALLVFYARDGFAGIRLPADLAAWWDRFGHGLAPGELDDLAADHPAILRTLATGSLMAERLVGLPAKRLLTGATLAHASELAICLSNWALLGDDAQIRANVSLIDWALAPAGQWRALWRRNLWPPERALGWLSPEGEPRGTRLQGSRALHLARTCVRYAIALSRAWLGRWAHPARAGHGLAGPVLGP